MKFQEEFLEESLTESCPVLNKNLEEIPEGIPGKMWNKSLKEFRDYSMKKIILESLWESRDNLWFPGEILEGNYGDFFFNRGRITMEQYDMHLMLRIRDTTTIDPNTVAAAHRNRKKKSWEEIAGRILNEIAEGIFGRMPTGFSGGITR